MGEVAGLERRLVIQDTLRTSMKSQRIHFLILKIIKTWRIVINFFYKATTKITQSIKG